MTAKAKETPLAFVITMENKSAAYQNLKAELSTIAQVEDVFYANKKYNEKTMAKKLNLGMTECTVLLVFCNPTFKTYLDGKKGDSGCDFLKKDEKSALEKGFKTHKNKIILIKYTDDGEDAIKPKCLASYSIHPTNDSESIDTLKDKIIQALTQANLSLNKK